MQVHPALLFILLSLAPTVETRYTIPAAIAMGADPLVAFTAGTFLNALLAISLAYTLWLFDPIIQRLPVVGHLWVNYVRRARERAEPYVEKYGGIGMILFVALPLPGTGIWTGSIAGYILGYPRRRLAAYTFLGGLIANIITTLSAVGILSLI